MSKPKILKTDNINNSKSKMCQRCNQREAIFCCLKCELYKLYCRYCDSYVHSLPSKKVHCRYLLDKNTTSNNDIEVLDTDKDNPSKINYKDIFSSLQLYFKRNR